MTDPSFAPAGLLVLQRLEVQNANAISGPLSWGFPSPTAFTGLVHALERKFAGTLSHGFGGVGIVCHRFEPQVFAPPGRRHQVFRLTRNPVGKDGGATALVEEGRTHLEISLVIEVKDYFGQRQGEAFATEALDHVQAMRIAGGSVLPSRRGGRFSAQWWPLSDDLEGERDVVRKLRRQLLPGFALVQRGDVLAGRLAELRAARPDATALDALLDLSRLNFEPDMVVPDKPDTTGWGIHRRPGWLVPLPIGYAALSPLHEPGSVENARDDVTPFRFVESLYSLGEWLSPHRLDSLQQFLWRTEADIENGLYRCVNRYSDSISAAGIGNQ